VGESVEKGLQEAVRGGVAAGIGINLASRKEQHREADCSCEYAGNKRGPGKPPRFEVLHGGERGSKVFTQAWTWTFRESAF
jgi:hypothetical protein